MRTEVSTEALAKLQLYHTETGTETETESALSKETKVQSLLLQLGNSNFSQYTVYFHEHVAPVLQVLGQKLLSLRYGVKHCLTLVDSLSLLLL